MKWFTSLAAAGVLAAISAQAGPDEEYISIYQSIEDAEQTLANNNLSGAAQKFSAAQEALKRFKVQYPEWNQGTVDFRLQYVTDRLAKLGPVKTAPAPAATAPAAVAADPITELRQTVAQLQEERKVLNAKLQEALAAQPAAVDPLELKKAEGQIATLQKEKELLRVALEQEQGKAAKAADKSAAEQEIAALKTQLAAAAAPVAAAEREATAAREAAHTNALIVTALQLALKNTQEERDALLARLKAASEAPKAAAPVASTPTAAVSNGADSQVKALEKERDDLRKQLASLNKDLAEARAVAPSTSKNKNEKTPDANRVAVMSARLQVLEARSIPYTQEELAALKQGPLAMKNAPAKGESKRKELPAGAGILIAEAQRAYGQKNFTLAEEKYKEILKIDDKNVMTLGNLGVIQLEQGRMEEAEATLTKAQSIDPDDSFVIAKLGILRFRQAKYDDALNLLSRAADLEPKNPEVQNFLGMTLSEKGLRQPAETALRKAVELAPTYATAHHNLAVIYASQQPPFLELARYHYQKALDLHADPDPAVEKMLKK